MIVFENSYQQDSGRPHESSVAGTLGWRYWVGLAVFAFGAQAAKSEFGLVVETVATEGIAVVAATVEIVETVLLAIGSFVVAIASIVLHLVAILEIGRNCFHC